MNFCKTLLPVCQKGNLEEDTNTETCMCMSGSKRADSQSLGKFPFHPVHECHSYKDKEGRRGINGSDSECDVSD